MAVSLVPLFKYTQSSLYLFDYPFHQTLLVLKILEFLIIVIPFLNNIICFTKLEAASMSFSKEISITPLQKCLLK